MEQSPPWRANRFSGSQEIPSILLNPKVHYRIHECPQRVPIVGQLDLVHTTTSHLRKIHLNIILPSKPGSPKWALSLRFPPPKPCILHSFHPYALHAPSISFYSILSPEQYWVRCTDPTLPSRYFEVLKRYTVVLSVCLSQFGPTTVQYF